MGRVFEETGGAHERSYPHAYSHSPPIETDSNGVACRPYVESARCFERAGRRRRNELPVADPTASLDLTPSRS